MQIDDPSEGAMTHHRMDDAVRLLDIEALKAFLRERIANYKIPKTWSVLEAFATLPNGKVDKRAMRASLDSATSGRN